MGKPPYSSILLPSCERATLPLPHLLKLGMTVHLFSAVPLYSTILAVVASRIFVTGPIVLHPKNYYDLK
jgi:hypothetical protein